MNILQLDPVSASIVGYNMDQLSDPEKVTIVRRRVVYEELVVSKEEFNKMNKQLKAEWNDDFYLDGLDMVDINFPDLADMETTYTAFPGDVTSCTDDAIAFLFVDQKWTESHEPIQLARPTEYS
jgi:hypothetical protein